MDPITNGMRPIHPGEVLREEFLIPLGITAHALALELQVSAPRINDIVRERRAVTADTALRLPLSSETVQSSGWDCRRTTTWQ